jgi:hypothetical protein
MPVRTGRRRRVHRQARCPGGRRRAPHVGKEGVQTLIPATEIQAAALRRPHQRPSAGVTGALPHERFAVGVDAFVRGVGSCGTIT